MSTNDLPVAIPLQYSSINPLVSFWLFYFKIFQNMRLALVILQFIESDASLKMNTCCDHCSWAGIWLFFLIIFMEEWLYSCDFVLDCLTLQVNINNTMNMKQFFLYKQVQVYNSVLSQYYKSNSKYWSTVHFSLWSNFHHIFAYQPYDEDEKSQNESLL